MGYIYKIYNDVNNKIYVGQTSLKRPTDRYSQHRSKSLHLQSDDSSILHMAMNKYGLDNFHFEVIEEVDNDLLNEREIYWIFQFNSISPNGYNLTKGGDGSIGRPSKYKGIPRTEEVKEKIRKSWTEDRREWYSERFSGKNNPMYGKVTSEETRKKISEATSGEKNHFFGKTHTKEAKEKISQFQNKNKKQINQIDKDTNKVVASFESLHQMSELTGFDRSWISKASKMNKVAYGYKWKIIEKCID